MKVTIISLFLFCFVVVSYGLSPVPRVEWEPFVCNPNIKYQENDCNSCSCVWKEGLRCTKMMCPNTDPTLKLCIVGTAWNKGFNRCWCVKDYGTVCTAF